MIDYMSGNKYYSYLMFFRQLTITNGYALVTYGDYMTFSMGKII